MCVRGIVMLHLAAPAVALAATAASHAGGPPPPPPPPPPPDPEFYYEHHTLTHTVDNPQYGGGEDFETWQFPLFDTQGGKRQLHVIDYTYSINYELNYIAADNNTSESVGAVKVLYFEFQNTRDGAPFLPGSDFPNADPVTHEPSFSVALPANTPGATFPLDVSFGVAESLHDTDFLNSLTGAGTIEILDRIVAPTLTSMDHETFCTLYPERCDDDEFIPDVYDPDSLTLELLSLSAELEWDYVYTVPAPPSLALLIGGCVCTRARRRRRE